LQPYSPLLPCRRLGKGKRRKKEERGRREGFVCLCLPLGGFYVYCWPLSLDLRGCIFGSGTYHLLEEKRDRAVVGYKDLRPAGRALGGKEEGRTEREAGPPAPAPLGSGGLPPIPPLRKARGRAPPPLGRVCPTKARPRYFNPGNPVHIAKIFFATYKINGVKTRSQGQSVVAQ